MSATNITQVETPHSRCRFALAWGDITPPANIYHRMWGAAKHERATGIHRPLRATVAIFEAGVDITCAGSLALRGTSGERAGERGMSDEPSASSPRPSPPSDGGEGEEASAARHQILLALDHCVLGAVEHGQLVAHIAQTTGQASESILVVFSHTHGAGLMGLERASLPGGDLIPGYLRSLAECAAGLVKEALGRLAPAAITYGHGRCNLAAHRDFWDAERQLWACGFNPAAPADDTVLVARVTGADGKLLASVVNYACHPTTLAWDNTLISPDYIGALREVVERETGAPCLFLQGASAELGPVEGFVGDAAIADRNGRQLAYAALSALTALPTAGTRFRYTGPVVSGATLGAWAHEPLSAEELAAKEAWQVTRWNEPLPHRPGQPTAAQVEAELKQFQADEEAARAAGDSAKAADCRAMAERKRRLLHRLSQLPPGDAFPLQVTLWRMGDAFWLGVQGEFYSVLQTELRRRFPGKAIVVATIAADWGASYLPPAKLYGTGIYQETIAVVAPGSLEQVIESVARRMKNF